MIAIPHELEQPFLEMAEYEHISPSELLAQLIAEALEDYHDARLAEQAIKRLERGESSTISLEEWGKQLDAMEN